ncbi:MAG: UbiX family flavin prenyltransferase [Proteobacteria bacterium]|nr:UbiX family flavin prenyltransferase [Pseudomonadota bacterium]
MSKRVVVAISGSSAPIYGIRLLQVLRDLEVETHLVLSAASHQTIAIEAAPLTAKDVKALATFTHESRNVAAPISSGSFRTDGMVVAPCSMKTLAAIAHGFGDGLVARAADVTLKERRRLILVPRETPLHLGHLRNMAAVTEMGAVVLPPVPAFYHRPRSIDDLIDHTVGKMLDLLGIEHALFKRWDGPPDEA